MKKQPVLPADERERLVKLARAGVIADDPATQLRALLEQTDLEYVRGFHKACDAIVEQHAEWRNMMIGEAMTTEARQAFDAGLGASRQTIIDWHEETIAEVKGIRRRLGRLRSQPIDDPEG